MIFSSDSTDARLLVHEQGSTIAVPAEIAVLETQRSDHHAVLFWGRVQ